jgi:hypothetical protein
MHGFGSYLLLNGLESDSSCRRAGTERFFDKILPRTDSRKVRKGEFPFSVQKRLALGLVKLGDHSLQADLVTYLDRDMEFVWTLKHLDEMSWQTSSLVQINSHERFILQRSECLQCFCC